MLLLLLLLLLEGRFFCGRMLNDQECTIYGDGKQLRDYVYVKDVAAINLLVLEKGEGEIFNIGVGVGTSVNELYKHLSQVFKFDKKAKYAPPRAGELFRSVLNCEKAHKLGWKAETDIRAGLEQTLAWYKT